MSEMSCMVVLWSTHSVQSHWVIEEAEEGLSRDKLLPLLIDDVPPPRGFRGIQALSFCAWDRTATATCFRQLLEDLDRLVPRPHAHGGTAIDPDAPDKSAAPRSESIAALEYRTAVTPSRKPAESTSMTPQPFATELADREAITIARSKSATQDKIRPTVLHRSPKKLAIAGVLLLALALGFAWTRVDEKADVAAAPTPSSSVGQTRSALDNNTATVAVAGVRENTVSDPLGVLPSTPRESQQKGTATARVQDLGKAGIFGGLASSTKQLPLSDDDECYRRLTPSQKKLLAPSAPSAATEPELAALNEFNRCRQERLKKVLDDMDEKARQAIRHIKAG